MTKPDTFTPNTPPLFRPKNVANPTTNSFPPDLIKNYLFSPPPAPGFPASTSAECRQRPPKNEAKKTFSLSGLLIFSHLRQQTENWVGKDNVGHFIFSFLYVCAKASWLSSVPFPFDTHENTRSRVESDGRGEEEEDGGMPFVTKVVYEIRPLCRV